MPLDHQPMTVHKSYPNAEVLMSFGREKPTAEEQAKDDDAGTVMINSWWSMERRGDIVLWRKDGKLEWGVDIKVHSFLQQLKTLGASDAWGIEQEAKAINLLATLLRHHRFKQYMLTGAFLETSKRSGVTYMFRHLRPTVALSTRGGETKILAALCLHPIAFYEQSWAGAMCPTDDVIAHLMLMRGDEALFWKRANQHPPYRPEAGL